MYPIEMLSPINSTLGSAGSTSGGKKCGATGFVCARFAFGVAVVCPFAFADNINATNTIIPQNPLRIRHHLFMNETKDLAIHRILDASANRASEGLRTMEEYARFALDDAALSTAFKKARHDLAAGLGRISRIDLLSARDSVGDVGTEIREATEYIRVTAADVIAAAASRTAQSLRVIEEYGKTIDGELAAEIERVRYAVYTAAADLELKLSGYANLDRVAAASLYVLVDAGPDESAYRESIERLCVAGVDVIQLRDRSPDDRTLIDRARTGTEIARRHDVLFIMNDRADLALAAGTDGVHVGQEELPVAVARKILGPNRLIGLSTHSIEQARAAVAEGADYIGCGPVFAGRTKMFDAYVGPEFIAEVAREIHLPAFAIGGIDLDNVDQVIAAGMRRVAVTGVVRDADDPATAVQRLKEKLASVS